MLTTAGVNEKVILVTGGAGFIGCAVSQLIAPISARFTAVDILHPQIHPTRTRPRQLHKAAELIVADITDRSTWEEILGENCPDIVIHLASETGTAQSLSEATRHARVNVVGTTCMLDAFSSADKAPGAVVLSSSRAVYGEGRWQRSDGTVFYPGMRSHQQLEAGDWDFADSVPIASDSVTTVPNPTSVYGATKLAQEHILAAWCGARDVALRILRLQNVYGPGQSISNSYTGIVSLFSRLARRGDVIPLYEDGRMVRDFVYIDDVARSIVKAVIVDHDLAHLCIDVGSGDETCLFDLATEIAQLRASPAPVVTGMYRDGDVRHASCSIDLAKSQLGWSADVSLVQGLRELQDWIDYELSCQF